MSSPELSICIPAYNSEHFLPDALRSVMCQGLSDFEIVVVDNASEDGTKELIHSMRNPHIRYSRNEVNVGSRENHNICMTKAQGRYIKFLCADDIFLDGLLLKQLNILRTRSEVGLVTCDLILTDSNLNRTGGQRYYPGSTSGSRVIEACLGGLNNYIGGPSNVMLRKSAVQGLRMDSSYRWVSDLKLWLQILERGDYVNINENGCLYRRHAEADSVTNCPVEIRMGEYFQLVAEFDQWNAFNSVQAVRHGGVEGRALARKNWRKAYGPTGLKRTLMTAVDCFKMHSATWTTKTSGLIVVPDSTRR
jgi:glycosyltransferase involved in cell wall biosynthesis